MRIRKTPKVVEVESGSMLLSPALQAELNQLLWEAREQIEMWADVVEKRTGEDSWKVRDLVRRIDRVRRRTWGQGPEGFHPPDPNPQHWERRGER